MDIPKGGGFATNLVAKERKKVCFMYREQPDRDKNWDTGWRFFSGTEDQEYVDDPSNIAVYALTTIVEIDPDIAPYLDMPAPCAFERDEPGKPFRESVGFHFQPEEK